MATTARLTHTVALILQAVACGYRYGFDVMSVTGLPSGTVYPALRRLEEARLVRSSWEDERAAHRSQRPARKNYTITRPGERALAEAVRRFHHLERALPLAGDRPRTSGA